MQHFAVISVIHFGGTEKMRTISYRQVMMSSFALCVQGLALFSMARGQNAGEWVWLGGSDGIAQPAVFGEQGVPSVNNRPSGTYAAATWADFNGNFWLFGGITQSAFYSSILWRFDSATQEWTWITGNPDDPNTASEFGTQGQPSTENHPGSRGFGMLCWRDGQGMMWVMGGYGLDGNGILSWLDELWRFNPATLEWTFVEGSMNGDGMGEFGIMGVASEANKPPAICETMSNWVRNGDELWFHGGQNSTGLYDNVWKYDISEGMWTWMSGSGSTQNVNANWGTEDIESPSNTPGGRASTTSFTHDGMFYLLGGWSYQQGYPNDVWRYNPVNSNWTWIGGGMDPNADNLCTALCDSISTNQPGSVMETRAFWRDGCGIWFLGGIKGLGNMFNDLWYFNLEEERFYWINGSGTYDSWGDYGVLGVSSPSNQPSARNGCTAWRGDDGRLWLFGGMGIDGQGSINLLNDLWVFQPDPLCVAFCAPDPKNEVVADFSVEGNMGCAPFEVAFENSSLWATMYQWTFGDGGTSSDEDPIHTFQEPGVYDVVLIATDEMASDTATITIQVGPSTIAAFSYSMDGVCPPQEISFVNESSGSTSYLWVIDPLFTTDAGSFDYVLGEGEYVVTLVASNAFGCVDTAQTTVVLTECDSIYLIIPNIFSPNADGYNDQFEILSAGMKKYSVQIYNRWGEILFESDDPLVHWNGTKAGSGECPEGTYYYILQVTDLLSVTGRYEGHLTLVR